MARIGITFLEVSQAADSLIARGEQPTLRNLRIELGNTGSPNTIQKHLSVWRDARPVPMSAATQLSEGLLNAIAAEIVQAEAKAKAALERDLVEKNSVVADLAELGDTLETEIDTLRAQLQEALAEKDQVAAVNKKLLEDVTMAMERLEREQGAAESARIETAKALLKIEATSQRVAEQEDQLKDLKASLANENQGRISAEKMLAVESAKLDSADREIKTLKTQVAGLELKISGLNEAAVQIQIQHKDEIMDLRSALENERKSHAQARVEAATAAGKLDAMAMAKAEGEALLKSKTEGVKS